MVKKLSFGQTSGANRGLVFMPNRGLHAFMGFPGTAHKLRSEVYAKPRSVTDMCHLVVFDRILVSERLGDDRGWVRDVVQ